MLLSYYNADVVARGDPEPDAAFKAAIRAADTLLMATPAYNHGVPCVLKNARGWTSHPHRVSALGCKPVANMGVTAGRGSTLQAQAQSVKPSSMPVPVRWRSWSSRARAPHSTTPYSQSV